MPANSSDGDGSTSTRDSLASNCSDWLRTKRGQASAPGMSDFSAANIWQPLQTPSAKLSVRRKNCSKVLRARALNRMDLAQPCPAPSTSP
jgi:hypothetical protein